MSEVTSRGGESSREGFRGVTYIPFSNVYLCQKTCYGLITATAVSVTVGGIDKARRIAGKKSYGMLIKLL